MAQTRATSTTVKADGYKAERCAMLETSAPWIRSVDIPTDMRVKLARRCGSGLERTLCKDEVRPYVAELLTDH